MTSINQNLIMINW